jgi:hypothetical protein
MKYFKLFEHFIEEILSLKSKYGSSYFEKKGLHAVLGDLANNIDNRIISVLKKADEVSLPEKLKKLRDEEDSIRAIQVFNLKQDFVENIGLEATISALVFDVYLFGLGLKQELNTNEYKATQASNDLQISELIELALADKHLGKSEMISIFKKGKLFGLNEYEIFDTLVQCIMDHNLKPLPYSDSIQPKSKEILLKYDWVDESIMKEELQRAKILDSDKEKEQRRLLEIQKEQALANQREKELEINRIELELKKKDQEAKENAEQKQLELEKRKRSELKKQKRAQAFNSILNWFLKKDVKGDSPLVWTLVILFLGGGVYWVINESSQRDKRENEAQEMSIQLEKRFEKINTFIQDGLIDSAKIILPDLVHPSVEISPYKPEGLFKENYKYNEYWQLKREELRLKIQEFQNVK